MRVWVVTIEHKHGTDTAVHRTEEGAQRALQGYVDRWAEEEGVSNDIDEYFEATGEGFLITETEIQE